MSFVFLNEEEKIIFCLENTNADGKSKIRNVQIQAASNPRSWMIQNHLRTFRLVLKSFKNLQAGFKVV